MPQNGCISGSRPADGAPPPNRICQTNAEARGGTHSRCTKQTMAKKEGLVASIRPRLRSAQEMVMDMTTRVGKHPNLAGRHAKQKQFGSSRGSKRRVGCFRAAQTENGKLNTENGQPRTENRKTKNETKNRKQNTENGTPKKRKT